MRRVLGIRDARLFLAGWSLSVFGDWAMFIVLGVWTKDLTKSNSAAGLVFFALALPSLLSPLAGLVVDRLPRRPLLIWTYAAEAVVVLSLLFVHDRGDVWIIYAVTVFYGAAGTFAASARSALMTVMLPRELLRVKRRAADRTRRPETRRPAHRHGDLRVRRRRRGR